MRRLCLVLAMAVVPVLAAGCGDSSSGSSLDTTLSYFPKDAPLVAAVDTKLDDAQWQALDKIAKRFPFSEQIKRGIVSSIERSGHLNFEKDLRPQLGNPLVIGAPTTGALRGDLLIVAQGKDADKVKQLVERSGMGKVGEKDGATLYGRAGGNVVGVKGTTVLAGSRPTVDAALDRASGGDHLSESSFNSKLSGLPSDALVRGAGDLGAILRSFPIVSKAERVKWVQHVRGFGFTAAAHDRSVAVDLQVKTDPSGLSDADLPLATGDQAPKVVKLPGELAIGLRDPRHTLEFAQSAAQSIDPQGFAGFARAKELIKVGIGVDLDKDVVGQLNGDLAGTIAVDGSFGARAELKDPAAFKAALQRARKVLPSLAQQFGSGARLVAPHGGQPLYTIVRPGGRSILFGVSNNVLVIANDPRIASELPAATPTAVAGAKGSLVIDADAQRLAQAFLKTHNLGALSHVPPFVLSPLGELKGSIVTSKDGLRGTFTLAID